MHTNNKNLAKLSSEDVQRCKQCLRTMHDLFNAACDCTERGMEVDGELNRMLTDLIAKQMHFNDQIRVYQGPVMRKDDNRCWTQFRVQMQKAAECAEITMGVPHFEWLRWEVVNQVRSWIFFGKEIKGIEWALDDQIESPEMLTPA